MIVTGGKIYDVCGYCNNLVRLNKPIVGSMHICVSPDERSYIDRCEEAKNKQINACKNKNSLGGLLYDPIDALRKGQNV